MKQLAVFKSQEKAYGGELRKRRKGRATGRPIATKHSMHLVLRSSKAKGTQAFNKPKNAAKIRAILGKFTQKYGIRIHSWANIGNHIHLHIQLANRHAWKPFIRAITAAIAMAITGASRWKKADGKFWDYRPFTRVVIGFKAFLTLKDYVQINAYEGFGHSRDEARFYTAWDKSRRRATRT